MSLDALDPDRHDRFRKVRGAWQNTVEGAEIPTRSGLPFIVQTTAGSHNVGELDAIAGFAHDRLAAKVWNLYFLVPTGRGQFVSDMTPAQYDDVLASLYRIQRKYDRRMLVNAKCAPHDIKTVLENSSAETDPVFRTYSGGAGGCPAGTHYMGIRPNGDVTPCPPSRCSGELFAPRVSRTCGRPRSCSPTFAAARRSAADAGLRDERAVRRLPRAGLRDDRRPPQSDPVFSSPEVVERVRKGTRFTVIYRNQPAFQIVPVNDRADAPVALENDSLYRAEGVGSSADDRTSADHDAVLYPRFRLGLIAADAWWRQVDGSTRVRWERVESDRFGGGWRQGIGT